MRDIVSDNTLKTKDICVTWSDRQSDAAQFGESTSTVPSRPTAVGTTLMSSNSEKAAEKLKETINGKLLKMELKKKELKRVLKNLEEDLRKKKRKLDNLKDALHHQKSDKPKSKVQPVP